MPQSNQFNPLNDDNRNLSARQLTRAAQIAQQSVLSTGPDMMSGFGSLHTRAPHPEPDVAWYKIISELGAGVYTCRRQTWKVSTKVFVDASGVDDFNAYEAAGTTGIAVGVKFFSQREFELADAVIVVFDWAASGGLATGLIVMWSGTFANIPAGWVLCDGDNSTPDLRGRFIVGSFEDTGVVDGGGAGDLGETGDYAAANESGGKAWHGQTENNHPDHSDHVHIIGTQDVQSGTGVVVDKSAGNITSIQVTQLISGALTQRHGGGADGVNTWVGQTPTNEAHPKADTDNRPPWYSLMFIMKT